MSTTEFIFAIVLIVVLLTLGFGYGWNQVETGRRSLPARPAWTRPSVLT
ncbi:MAG: hypothetical protein U0793_22500 [Gemmataceae bacterium]